MQHYFIFQFNCSPRRELMMRLRPPRAQGWRALLGVAVIVLSSGLIEAGPVQKRSPGDDMKDDN